MNMNLKKNDIIPLSITGTDLSGNGIGRYDGMAVFTAYAAAGDEVDSHIIKVRKNCAFAKIEKIRVPSPDRILPVCPVYNKCGGCVFGHITYDAELRIKENHVRETLKRIGGIEPEIEPIIASEKTSNYRNKAQYPVEITEGVLKAGFYAPHSHRVIDCPGCTLQPEEFPDILSAFGKYARITGISSYDEEKHEGLLRHIYLRKATGTGEIMVCPVINGDKLPREDLLTELLLESCTGIKSIIVNINREKTNVITGEKCRTIYRSDYITDILCGIRLRISPLSFYQVNREQAENLYRKAAEYASLTGTETVLDLYCGTGSIGLSMASKAKKIYGVEIVSQAVSDAVKNAEENGISNAEFICSDAAGASKELAKRNIRADVIILDPPRKGCSREMIESAVGFSPERIVYVSCDPATLARDCRLFGENGYTVRKAAPVDMFPRTGHVETVVLLSQQKPKFTVDME